MAVDLESGDVLDSDHAELNALGEAWIDAEVADDRAALEQILDERFVATQPNGRTIDRSAFIEMILAQDLEPFESVHELIEVHGDVAVVIDRSESLGLKTTWIAQRQVAGWRVLAETFTRISVD